MNKYNFNNLKNIVPVNTMAVVISILALFIAVSSGTTPCLSADSVCSSGVDPEYTNNLSVKAGTTNKATFTHNNLNGDNQYFFPESNYSRTSSVAILKKGSDQLNILDLQNGSIIIGQSQTTTVGALRVQTSTIPVLQLYGSAGWQDVGAVTPDQNVFTTINANTGSLTASTTTTSIKLEADPSTNLTVVASGDKLEIQSTGAGGVSTQFASFSISSDQTLTYSGGSTTKIDFDTEDLDTENCWSTSTDGTITYDASCSSAYFQYTLNSIINFSGLTSNQAMIQGNFTGSITPNTLNYRNWVTLMSVPNFTLSMDRVICVDPSDTMRLDFFHGAGYSTGSAIWLGGTDDSSLNFIKLQEKGSSC